MEKQGLLGGSSPPPYHLPAYPHQRRRRRLMVRGRVSVRTVLTFVLTASVVWLCLAFSRETRWRQHGDGASSVLMEQFDEAVAQCQAIRKQVLQPSPEARRENPRWIASNGQQKDVVLKNAKLFDGETFVDGLVDIAFSKGLIQSVTSAGEKTFASNTVVHDVNGRYVTPGLVDMHSHHLTAPWPSTGMNMDFSETHPDTGPLTPQVRILDGIKPYDIAATIVCSGGVTSSMIIPGSANIIGGEGTAVKNVLNSGKHGEPVVEDLLLERGIPADQRRRYMKMAFGENPKRVWGYSRLGTAWHLRKHMQRGKDLREKQDEYCHSMDQARVQAWGSSRRARLIADRGKFPFDLELESTVALLRGKVALHNHNYEPEDMQTMLRISREFGYKVKAFHHATAAWQIPHLLKEEAENITIAIFAEFSLYKAEAYFPSLAAASVLSKHGINVAYKSDHSGRELSAKYLASQAAIGHSFHLPADKALQSITSIPAKAMDQGHRIGYCRKGYDADIAVWDEHPLEVGATPLQVFVDGQPQLDNDKVKTSTGSVFDDKLPFKVDEITPVMRVEGNKDQKRSCTKESGAANVIITGIKKSLVDKNEQLETKAASGGNLELIIENGEVACFGAENECRAAKLSVQDVEGHVSFSLTNGHVSRGLTAVANALGMHEIATESNSGDGDAKGQKLNDPDSVVYAKHGVHLDGKEFARARLGGVTRAVTGAVTELDDVQGVSVQILTSGKKSVLHGGIVQDEVSFRVTLGTPTFAAHGSVSRGVETLRRMLKDGQGKHNSTVYGRVVRGELPLVVRSQNKYDIAQLVLVKRDYPDVNLVLFGGQEASLVAKDLAEANIPVLLSEGRTAPDSFRTEDALPGPPLSRSPASYLHEAGVKFGISLAVEFMPADFRLNSLGPEAGWTGKYAGMNETEQMALVTTNIEEILGLKKSEDLVIFEGSPLRYGATVVMALHGSEDGKLEVASCYPEEG